jgi:energy-coupling factor transport system substrate-specific component
MLGALLLSVQVGLAFLPNVELVSLFIIVYTIVFRKKALYIISIFILLEGILYGFGLWWLNYLYVWFVLYLITMIFRKEHSSFLWAMISGVYGLFFGALCAILYFFIGSYNGSLYSGFQSAFAYWISGIPFDLTHGIANFLIALILFKPLYRILDRLNETYYPITNE